MYVCTYLLTALSVCVCVDREQLFENYENLTSSITNFMCARVLSVKTKKN